MTTTRRVRMCGCPLCGFVFMVRPRARDDPPGINLQTCPQCFFAMDANAERTWLEQPNNPAPQSD